MLQSSRKSLITRWSQSNLPAHVLKFGMVSMITHVLLRIIVDRPQWIDDQIRLHFAFHHWLLIFHFWSFWMMLFASWSWLICAAWNMESTDDVTNEHETDKLKEKITCKSNALIKSTMFVIPLHFCSEPSTRAITNTFTRTAMINITTLLTMTRVNNRLTGAELDKLHHC